jgi:hypothetical protein
MTPGILDELLAALRRLGDRLPGTKIKTLTITFEDGGREPLVVLPFLLTAVMPPAVRPGAMPETAVAPWPELKTDLESDIWEVLGDDQTLTAKEIAYELEIDDDAHLHRTLSGMRKRHLLTGGFRSRGYSRAQPSLP